MAFLRGFGLSVPSRVAGNAEVAAILGAEEEWILRASGIEERRFAAAEDSVAGLGAAAARNCLENAGAAAQEIGLLIVASGSAERRFPGPASAIGSALGIGGTPAIDLPMASAGSLFGMALASRLSRDYGNVMVVGSEIMSRVVRLEPEGRDTAILFGDGAGACLVSEQTGFAEVRDFILASDGEFRDVLRLEFDGPIHMEGRSVILQAARKLPRVIEQLLDRNGCRAADIGAFLMHQANLNLITRVAQTLKVPETSFYTNLQRYGNTSSASMLIAAAEWWRGCGPKLQAPAVFAAFGAGLNWGALLAVPPAAE